jgi:hypothetical protein
MAKAVQLRILTRAERRVLQVKMRDRRLSVRLHRRYRLLAEVARGRSFAEVADRVGCNPDDGVRVDPPVQRQWVHDLRAAPNPKGRLPIITGPQIRELIDIALSSPTERGLPFPVWTVPKLAAYCRQRGLLPPITDEWVRRQLRREGLRAQRIRTWKTSRDPAFDRKKSNRQLYQACPPRAAVVCFDEWGPLELKPLGGVTRARQHRPQRMRATYHRRQGTEQFLGFYGRFPA